MKPGDIVELIWKDSTASSHWQDIDADAEPSRIITVGYVLKVDKDVVVLTHSVSDNDNRMGYLTIPKSVISKIKQIGKRGKL